LGNIFLLRSVPDVQKIVSALGESKGKNVVIVGSGFIGLEVANAMAKDNQVTVVDMLDVPLKPVLGSEVGSGIQKLFEGKGVKFHMDAGVEKAAPSANDSSKVGAVHLKDGTILYADFVVSGIGVGPATEYLRGNSSVQLDRDGALTVDRHFKVPGVQDIYAIGDIARFPYDGPTGNGALTRIEHWSVAQNHGRAVGASLSSTNATPKRYLPIFWSALTAQMRYCGNLPNGWDEVHIDGNPAEGKFAAYYAKDGVVGAVATMGKDPIMVKSMDLMERGIMPSKSELEKGADVLAL
jgi:NADPH-dependent 2,4-dienoyl-CoA reductase/sulfur reductase-like enzyme